MGTCLMNCVCVFKYVCVVHAGMCIKCSACARDR